MPPTITTITIHVRPSRGEPRRHSLGAGAAIGLTLHSLVDGVAMAAAVQAEGENNLAAWAGLGAALAVTLHKPFDSLTIGNVAGLGRQIQGYTTSLERALLARNPLGVLLFYLASGGPDPM